MKFDVWKDIVSQSSYLKSQPDPVTLRGVGEEERVISEKLEKMRYF